MPLLTHHSQPLGTDDNLLLIGGEEQLPRGGLDLKHFSLRSESTGPWGENERERKSQRKREGGREGEIEKEKKREREGEQRSVTNNSTTTIS